MRARAQEEYAEYVTGRLASLRQLAFLLCGDAHRTDDIVQLTIEKLYLRWARVCAVEHLDQYVRQMLVRTFLDGKPATEYGAFDVRNGWVAGTAGTTGVLWNLRTGEVRVVAWGMLMAVNGRGWTLLANEPRAAVDTGTQRVDLPSVPGAEGGVYALAPAVLSDDGRFAAGTAITSANGHRAGTRWTCR